MKVIALLRGINVGGNKKISMPELCNLLKKTGFTEVETYINSGNLIFESEKMEFPKLEDLLEKKIQGHFGFPVDIILRSATQWKNYAQDRPFPSAARSRPNLLLLGLAKESFNKNISKELLEKALFGENIKIIQDAIWVDFANGIGKSKLTPAWFDKIVGSKVTMRNWNTVLKLVDLLK